MPAARLTVLLAAALMVAAELVSLGLVAKHLGDRQEERLRAARDQAAAVLARVAEGVRELSPGAKTQLTDVDVHPFDSLNVQDLERANLSPAFQKRLESFELVAAQREDRTIEVVGILKTGAGSKVLRLGDSRTDSVESAADQTLIVQHALILFTALIGFALAARGRERTPAADSAPSLRAYEEAMLRLRLRDDQRLAGFEREKAALTEVLRDREAMARAGELTAGIVHEVRNSIGAIAMQARHGETATDARVCDSARAIAEEVRLIQGVMTRFVDFIRTEEVQTVDFDLAKLVGNVVKRERSNHNARIEIRGDSVLVRGDEGLLERAIENVLRNAIQASGELGSVQVTWGVDGGASFVLIEDDGEGIANVEDAVRPFQSGRPGGLGLGLPLVLKILDLHQGGLDLLPRFPRGTRAIIRWPNAAVAATSGNVE